MFKQNFINLCNQKKESPSAVCKKVGITPATFSCWTEESVPRRATLQRIADYFGVSIDYLLGNEKEKSPSVTDEDVKVALFGGEKEITPEMWEDVKKYVEFVKSKYGLEK